MFYYLFRFLEAQFALQEQDYLITFRSGQPLFSSSLFISMIIGKKVLSVYYKKTDRRINSRLGVGRTNEQKGPPTMGGIIIIIAIIVPCLLLVVYVISIFY